MNLETKIERKRILITGGFLGLIAVVLGAFGAHGLQAYVPDAQINSFQTGVRYQMFHAMVCLILGNMTLLDSKALRKVFYFFMVGIILFSGSIYLLVVDDILGVSLSSIGFVTPLGGLLLIFGWILLIISLYRIK